MITAELFVLCKLFIPSEVDWIWLVLFILSDWTMWYSIRNYIEN